MRRRERKRRKDCVRSGYKILECSRACFRAMSLESRSSSALFKRAEQLKRWEQSETNREPTQPRQVARKIKFSADCVFLAACAAGDKEEVVRLLQKGADINTGNVDGLTALHQVKFFDYSFILLFIWHDFIPIRLRPQQQTRLTMSSPSFAFSSCFPPSILILNARWLLHVPAV